MRSAREAEDLRAHDTERSELPMQLQLITPTFGDERLPARFWAKVRLGPVPAHRPDLGPCWEWMAYRNRKDYGRFGGRRADGGNRMVLAHRWAYETLIGPIPDGLEPDHLCRNHPCVRPSHLEPVTHIVNMQRSPLKWGRNGEANGRAKLTEEQVREIRQLRGAVSQRKLATRFGVQHAGVAQPRDDDSQ